jgi:hypothetical protein
MGAMKRTILVLSVLLAMAGTAPASAALLGADPRLGETLLNTRIRQVAGDVIAERLPGSSRLRNPGQLLRKPGVPPILRPSEFSTSAHMTAPANMGQNALVTSHVWTPTRLASRNGR